MSSICSNCSNSDSPSSPNRNPYRLERETDHSVSAQDWHEWVDSLAARRSSQRNAPACATSLSSAGHTSTPSPPRPSSPIDFETLLSGQPSSPSPSITQPIRSAEGASSTSPSNSDTLPICRQSSKAVRCSLHGAVRDKYDFTSPHRNCTGDPMSSIREQLAPERPSLKSEQEDQEPESLGWPYTKYAGHTPHPTRGTSEYFGALDTSEAVIEDFMLQPQKRTKVSHSHRASTIKRREPSWLDTPQPLLAHAEHVELGHRVLSPGWHKTTQPQPQRQELDYISRPEVCEPQPYKLEQDAITTICELLASVSIAESKPAEIIRTPAQVQKLWMEQSGPSLLGGELSRATLPAHFERFEPAFAGDIIMRIEWAARQRRLAMQFSKAKKAGAHQPSVLAYLREAAYRKKAEIRPWQKGDMAYAVFNKQRWEERRVEREAKIAAGLELPRVVEDPNRRWLPRRPAGEQAVQEEGNEEKKEKDVEVKEEKNKENDLKSIDLGSERGETAEDDEWDVVDGDEEADDDWNFVDSESVGSEEDRERIVIAKVFTK